MANLNLLVGPMPLRRNFPFGTKVAIAGARSPAREARALPRASSRDDELSDLEACEGETPSVRAGLAAKSETGVLPRTSRALPGLREFPGRGAIPRTAHANARMCSGVVPQQPPTRLSQPFSAHLATFGAKVPGVSGKPVGESGSGRPAFGYALM